MVNKNRIIAIVIISLFIVTLIHIPSERSGNDTQNPDAETTSIFVQNISYDEKEIRTCSNNSIYYNITETHYLQTEYSFNLSWEILLDLPAFHLARIRLFPFHYY